jgi:SAM-dependent methyltransferase
MTQDGWSKTHLRAMKVRPPFSPTEEDIAFVREMTAPALSGPACKVLVLGTTPALVQCDWPTGTEITAVDSSPGMVASFQPHPSLASRALCAEWQNLPLDGGVFDAAAGDGSLNSLPTLNHYPRVFAELARVLKPDGALVLRVFVRPREMESPDEVVAASRAREFPTTAAFRFRLAMALAGEDGSVALAALHEAFDALVPDREALAAATGWPRADIDRVDVDRDSKVRFTFPTLERLASLCAGAFAIARLARGTYTQSAECPTVLFRPREVNRI